MEKPLITVIIPAYNYCEVLPYAIRSVLTQTEQRFELLVIGDCCTDNSEDVVKSFDDSRIFWFNLSKNIGHKAGPINYGLKIAKGEYIAYLAQDDLWHPVHLETLLDKIVNNNTDIVFSVIAVFGQNNSIFLSGISPNGSYYSGLRLNFISMMHKSNIVNDIGYWPLPSESSFYPFSYYLHKASTTNKKFTAINELTAFKVMTNHQNLYIDRPSAVQKRIEQEMQKSVFRYRILMDFIKKASKRPELSVESLILRPDKNSTAIINGELVKRHHEFKGLSISNIERGKEEIPSYTKKSLLELNNEYDIIPRRFRIALFKNSELPKNGIFLGKGWSTRWTDEFGSVHRRIYTSAQLVFTTPISHKRALRITMRYTHPDVNKSGVLQLNDFSGNIAEVSVDQKLQTYACMVYLSKTDTPYIEMSLSLSEDKNAGFITISEIDWINPPIEDLKGKFLRIIPNWQIKNS